ncbi:MAG: hypothetical protein AAB436_01380 [Patescibacteria group bacterium]
MRLFKRYQLVCAAFALLTGLAFFSSSASAAFSANNIMDEGVFNNYTSMNAGQIDSFLNGFAYSCISPNTGFAARVPTGYSPGGGYTYGGYGSAGAVIAASAQAYGLNPKVLIATLEKEQSLVTGQYSSAYCAPSAESNHKYAAAVGYGCPDSGTRYNYSGLELYSRYGVAQTAVGPTCVNSASKAGFSQQVIRAAWLLKFGQERSLGHTNWAVVQGSWDNTDDLSTCYGGPMTQGSYKRCPSDSSPVYYDGYTTIDGSGTHMDTGATAAFYWYTPHFHGNQNFVSLYESWFGPTKGVDYSWSYVNTSFSTGSSHLQGNTQTTVTVTVRNTGNQAWSNTNYPVRLGTFAPTNHGSALYDSSWVSPVRPATLTQSTVAPGDTGTFVFTINVPNRNEVYTERFNLVAEGAAWMPDIDFSLQLTLSKTSYKWQMVSQSSNAGFELLPGATAQFTMVAKNTGNTTWNNSTNPVRLATFIPTNRNSAFYDSSWYTASRPATLQESSVAPGQNGTFVFTVKAPNTSGYYVERFNLVMEGVSWFDDPWMEFDIGVGNFNRWRMVSQSSSTGSFVLPKNGTATFTLTALNTGNTTWNNSTNPVRLATWTPSYRTSVFNPNDASWPSAYRAATLDASTPSVAPGATGTFIFNVKAPNTSGFYVERFNLVMEGVSWFTDPWMEFDINVN